MRLSGWGRYPVVDCPILAPGDEAGLLGALRQQDATIARGNGRSYGDASLNTGGVIDMRRFDHLLHFDEATGQLVCEGGVLLSDVIAAMLPRGWFPPVTPGTKLVTIGGMIASDVHGKNHHASGSFCDHVEWIDLAIGADEVLRCSTTEHADLFAATCGGQGLTGIVLRVCFRLIRVESASIRQRTCRAPTLERAFQLFEESLGSTYSVAWIDCLANGSDLGRSVIFLGEHAARAELVAERRASPLAWVDRRRRRVPVDFPSLALSRGPVRIFNRLYYAAQRPGERIIDIDPYFYPLDALADWNRIYGRRGFVQYQCVLPLAESRNGIARLLLEISAHGDASFLAVLKRLGPQSFGMLSFPMSGYTLALDFPIKPATLSLLARLDAITLEHSGRVYLTKDARLSPEVFAQGYPRLSEFQAVRRLWDLDKRFSSVLSRRLDI